MQSYAEGAKFFRELRVNFLNNSVKFCGFCVPPHNHTVFFDRRTKGHITFHVWDLFLGRHTESTEAHSFFWQKNKRTYCFSRMRLISVEAHRIHGTTQIYFWQKNKRTYYFSRVRLISGEVHRIHGSTQIYFWHVKKLCALIIFASSAWKHKSAWDLFLWRHTESTESHRFIFDMLKNSAPLSSLRPLRENINPREKQSVLLFFCQKNSGTPHKCANIYVVLRIWNSDLHFSS